MIYRRLLTCLLLLPSLAGVARALAADAPGLSRADAEQQVRVLWAERVAELRSERAAELEARRIEFAGQTLRWEERVFGEAPTNGHSLWISMHGGGGAPKSVNDQQWRNQVRLYEPAEGIYVAPRAPTDNWNLWHEAHIDPLFDRLIADYVALRGVNPDRVYVMGYSAGGDGVWQIGPRMADRWAAAAMMAGHPNNASLLSLRNLPFAVFVGGSDTAYGRNHAVAERILELDRLRTADPGGYEHFGRIYPGLPHWMDRKDAEALPWMAKHSRIAWPKKVVWMQGDVPHTRFYWLAVPAVAAQSKAKIVAEVVGQEIRLTGDVPPGLTLRLNDELLNLDQPVRVLAEGREVFAGKVPRQASVIRASLAKRADPVTAATAELELPAPLPAQAK